MSIRSRLIQLVLAAAVPSILLAAFISVLSYRGQRDTVELHLRETTRAIALFVDRELLQAQSYLQGLGSSPYLLEGNLPAFHAEAKNSFKSDNYWVVLVDPLTGQQLLNTQLPFGAELPKLDDGDRRGWVRQCAETRKPVVKDIIRSYVTSGWVVTFQYPIIRDDRVAYVLELIIRTEVFQNGLISQQLPGDWLASVFDHSGHRVARSLDPEKFIAGEPAESLKTALQRQGEGVANTTSLEGTDIITAFTRSPSWQWIVAVGVPQSALLKSVYLSAGLTFAGAIGVSLAAIVLASLMAARIGNPIRQLARAAQAFGEGRTISVAKSKIPEVDLVASAFSGAVDQLQRRTAERDQHEAALKDLNATLEQRVKDRTVALETANERLASETLDRERAEEALLHAQKLEAVGQLTAGIAHDFNNLLTAVLGNLDLLERKVDDPIRKLARNAQAAAERGAKLTHQLLAFSRKQRLDPQPTDLNPAISSLSGMLHHTFGGRIGIALTLAPDLWLATADKNQIELCILNIAINSRDAMPGGGRLEICTENAVLPSANGLGLPAGDYVAVSVTDTGAGMSPEVMRRSFDPFFTTKGVGQGSGLGLSTVYGTVRQLGGDVRISSTVGVGTAITLYLPRAVISRPREDGAALSAAASRRVGGRILLVDDDFDVRQVLAEILRDMGHTVVEYSNGKAALDALERNEPFDLLIADFAMPEMTGEELLRRSRSLRPALPAFIVTGYMQLSAIDIANVAVLRKPIDTASLAAAVDRALEQSLASVPAPENIVQLRAR